MKESISVTAIFQIFILFVLLFTGIMALTINNSNAFGVKDEIINEIEKLEGINLGENLDNSIKEIIKEASYRTTGKCEDGYTGYDKEGNLLGGLNGASVCIRKVKVSDGTKDLLGDLVVSNDTSFSGHFYQVETFYQLDIPVIGIFNRKRIKGETKIIYDFN